MRVALSVASCPESHKAERSEVRTVPSRWRAFVCNDKQGVLHPDLRLRRWTVDLNRSVRCLLKKGPRGAADSRLLLILGVLSGSSGSSIQGEHSLS